jgi:hypothetical protein
MTGMSEKTSDRSVLDHIQSLVVEEERIFGQGAKTEADQDRLKAIGLALDQAWDLLRQRRALREYGRDPADAHVRPSEIVEKYLG